jgi:hypothetical protein
MGGDMTTHAEARRLYDKLGRERQRVKRCADDRAVLTESNGVIRCPECGRTAEQMAQATS